MCEFIPDYDLLYLYILNDMFVRISTIMTSRLVLNLRRATYTTEENTKPHSTFTSILYTVPSSRILGNIGESLRVDTNGEQDVFGSFEEDGNGISLTNISQHSQSDSHGQAETLSRS